MEKRVTAEMSNEKFLFKGGASITVRPMMAKCAGGG